MKATLGWVLVAVTMAVTVPPMAQAQVNVPAESEVATAVAPEPELATAVAPTNDAGPPGAQGCAEGETPSSGCPAGVWGSHHGIEADPDGGIGVVWCKFSSSFDATVGISFPVVMTVTVTFCNYSGCGLSLTQEEANTGE